MPATLTLAVTDGDIENILRVLEGLPFMTAVALIEALRRRNARRSAKNYQRGTSRAFGARCWRVTWR
jgi:hypothetical protein